MAEFNHGLHHVQAKFHSPHELVAPHAQDDARRRGRARLRARDLVQVILGRKRLVETPLATRHSPQPCELSGSLAEVFVARSMLCVPRIMKKIDLAHLANVTGGSPKKPAPARKDPPWLWNGDHVVLSKLPAWIPF